MHVVDAYKYPFLFWLAVRVSLQPEHFQSSSDTMRLGLLALLFLAATAKAANYSGPLRPQVQFTPPKGFMNDPNGLFYDAKRSIYHYYYQCKHGLDL